MKDVERAAFNKYAYAEIGRNLTRRDNWFSPEMQETREEIARDAFSAGFRAASPQSGGREELEKQITDAMSAYLRTCSSGGMPADLSKRISSALSEMLRLNYLEYARAAYSEDTQVVIAGLNSLLHDAQDEIAKWKALAESNAQLAEIAQRRADRMAASQAALTKGQRSAIEYSLSILENRGKDGDVKCLTALLTQAPTERMIDAELTDEEIMSAWEVNGVGNFIVTPERLRKFILALPRDNHD